MAELQLALPLKKRGRPAGPAKPMPIVPLNGLHVRRKAKGYSLEAIGALIGVNKAHMGKIEKGIVRLDIVRAAVIANHLGCDIGSLL